ncbi:MULTISPECIES: 50S ribosomal protein L20 [Staphylococcus]|uniref:Large ribosomal subunit protein bL20 n=5 Tax=Staphylococcus TaxID=1279 RepID=RL20_STACT|nr:MULTISPECIES: 50S ribosomal protein L20 [Staphylococcus]B9DNC4.1 RecName: Full=Large ribosomal subunit protein bL20; AltName: Full=50S ribosomal protein L20 [Staphylococcus carnosus subsp. carnosus TM300]AMY04584.1 50S ribosomal protein L20 [Staphylococcus condimenti]ANZ33178.1 50S ribosomal protein L20 [Staphylococcus carnosus]APR60822.1 50S ribosomal protein L20 [Staphylococcus condimenti]AYU55442.1 50S ribosomal protein L20 [Staphylococcus debuckii]KKB26074.1 50S ribosomal protein L20 [
MPRVKGGTVTRARRKKVIKLAKGYFGAKRTLYKTAKQQVMKSGQYAFRDRRQRKRDFRKLWITRINAAARNHGMSYSKLMNGLKQADIDINRKMLSEIAISDDKAFGELVEKAKAALK